MKTVGKTKCVKLNRLKKRIEIENFNWKIWVITYKKFNIAVLPNVLPFMNLNSSILINTVLTLDNP